jgi:hypothetical protein
VVVETELNLPSIISQLNTRPFSSEAYLDCPLNYLYSPCVALNTAGSIVGWTGQRFQADTYLYSIEQLHCCFGTDSN